MFQDAVFYVLEINVNTNTGLFLFSNMGLETHFCTKENFYVVFVVRLGVRSSTITNFRPELLLHPILCNHQHNLK
jgi:hypothetical protein